MSLVTLFPIERLWSSREAISTGNITLTALPRLQYFRCLLNRRGVQAAPVTNKYARRPPTGPGSCYEQWYLKCEIRWLELSQVAFLYTVFKVCKQSGKFFFSPALHGNQLLSVCCAKWMICKSWDQCCQWVKYHFVFPIRMGWRVWLWVQHLQVCNLLIDLKFHWWFRGDGVRVVVIYLL
jgi:hypothetical protein